MLKTQAAAGLQLHSCASANAPPRPPHPTPHLSTAARWPSALSCFCSMSSVKARKLPKSDRSVRPIQNESALNRPAAWTGVRCVAFVAGKIEREPSHLRKKASQVGVRGRGGEGLNDRACLRKRRLSGYIMWVNATWVPPDRCLWLLLSEVKKKYRPNQEPVGTHLGPATHEVGAPLLQAPGLDRADPVALRLVAHVHQVTGQPQPVPGSGDGGSNAREQGGRAGLRRGLVQ